MIWNIRRNLFLQLMNNKEKIMFFQCVYRNYIGLCTIFCSIQESGIHPQAKVNINMYHISLPGCLKDPVSHSWTHAKFNSTHLLCFRRLHVYDKHVSHSWTLVNILQYTLLCFIGLHAQCSVTFLNPCQHSTVHIALFHRIAYTCSVTFLNPCQ